METQRALWLQWEASIKTPRTFSRKYILSSVGWAGVGGRRKRALGGKARGLPPDTCVLQTPNSMLPGSVYSEDDYPVEFSFPATRHQAIERDQVFTPKRNSCLQGARTRAEMGLLESSRAPAAWAGAAGPCGPPKAIPGRSYD